MEIKMITTKYGYVIMHSGVGHDDDPPGRGSGRYPYGSGARPNQDQEPAKISKNLIDKIGNEKIEKAKKISIKTTKVIARALLTVGTTVVVPKIGLLAFANALSIPAVQNILSNTIVNFTPQILSVAKNMFGISNIQGVPINGLTTILATQAISEMVNSSSFYSEAQNQLITISKNMFPKI